MLGLVQLQLPTVVTKADLAAQTQRVVAMVGKARRNLATMDLVVLPEYALHGLSMDTNPDILCRMDGPEVAAFAKACLDNRIWGCFSIAPRMSVSENLAFRAFDRRAGEAEVRRRPAFWLDTAAMRRRAGNLIARFGVKTASAEAPIATLSGGNIQRAVLARELTDPIHLLVVANPCFGLDFSAVSEIRSRIVAARNAGAAVLLTSEDLDEILELSDCIVVMSDGHLVHEVAGAEADAQAIGRHMAGHR